VRARDDDRLGVPEPLIADRLRQRGVADAVVKNGLELRVAARDGIADDDEIESRGDVFGAVSLEHVDSLGREKIAHRRVNMLIGSADLMPAMFQERRQGGHRGTTDAYQMNSLCHVIGGS